MDEGRNFLFPAVPEVVCRAYARHAAAIDGDAAAVLAHAATVLNAPSRERAAFPDLPISILCDEIWRGHADLRYRFDVDSPRGRLSYLRWLLDEGAAALSLPAVFLDGARAAVDRQRVRELESADETGEPAAPSIGDAGAAPSSAETIAGLIAARDAERDRRRRQEADIRLLVGSNKGLRRDALALQVRRWRDEEKIEALEAALAEAGAALARCRKELAAIPPWLHRLFGDGSPTAPPERQEILDGEGPFFKRGFLVGDTAAAGNTTVRRIKGAPSGMMIFGPYLPLPAGRYVVTIDARLYRPLPPLADFKADVVCDGAQNVVAAHRFRLHSLARWQRCEIVFSVGEGEDYPDFEVRIWARRRTPLEIGGIGLYRLSEKTAAAPAA